MVKGAGDWEGGGVDNRPGITDPVTLRKEHTSIKTPSTASPSSSLRDPETPPYLML